MIRPRPLSYFFNAKLRSSAMRMVSHLKGRSEEERLDLNKERIERILLARATFRLGDSILALPAISIFRKNFPRARIDFVGGPIAKVLYQNLPVDHVFTITKRFPDASWTYLALLKQIRSVGYDLAVNVSCSQSAMGLFIVGLSAARFRVGEQGKWDFWFNVRIPRPGERSKYRILPAFLAAMGLETQDIAPSLILSRAETEEGKRRVESLIGPCGDAIVGVFVGGRKRWGNRWPRENFLQLIRALCGEGVKVVVFMGPEERDLLGFFRSRLEPQVPVVVEPSVRIFAAMISHCRLFITCDTGPMHLAPAVGVRTIAIFHIPKLHRWAPPSARILYQPDGVSVEEVLKVSLAELYEPRGILPEDVVKSCGAELENKTG